MSNEVTQQIAETFALLEDWEDKYKYLIELGTNLEPLPTEFRCSEYKVAGCTSQVWLKPNLDDDNKLKFMADSDAHTVKGLLFLALSFYNGKTLEEAAHANIVPFLKQLDLNSHISLQRSNGLYAVIEKIKAYITLELEKRKDNV